MNIPGLKSILGWSLAGTVSVNSVRLLFSVCSAVLAGPELVGEFLLIVAFVELGAIVSDVALGQIYFQKYSKGPATNVCQREDEFNYFVRRQFLISSLYLCLVALMYPLMPADWDLFIVSLVLGKWITLVASIHMAEVYVNRGFKTEARVNMSVAVCQIILLGIGAVGWVDIKLMLTSYVLLANLGSLVTVLSYHNYPGLNLDPTTNKQNLFGLGWSLLVYNATNRLKMQIQTLLLGLLLPVGQVGQLMRGIGLFEAIVVSFNTVIKNPLISTGEAWAKDLTLTIKWMLLCLVGLIGAQALLNLIISQPLQQLLGQEWNLTIEVLLFLVGLLSPALTIVVFKVGLLATGKYFRLAAISLIELAILIVTFLVFLGFLGPQGIKPALALLLGITYLVLSLSFRRQIGWPLHLINLKSILFYFGITNG